MLIPEKEVHVYNLHSDDFKSNNKKYILSEDEILKSERFRFEKDKINYVNCRSFLRILIGRYLECLPENIKFSYTKYGKPYIENVNLYFNLSHSSKHFVYAFGGNKNIGIDTEFIKEMPDALEIAKRYFSEYEFSEIVKASKQNINKSFFKCWTRKEAFIKAIGEGLSYPLDSFSVTLNPEDKPEILWINNMKDETKHWSLYNLDFRRDFITSLAIRERDVKIVYMNTDELF